MQRIALDTALSELDGSGHAYDLKTGANFDSAFSHVVLQGAMAQHQIELAANETVTPAKAPAATHPHVSPQLHAAPRGPSGNSFH